MFPGFGGTSMSELTKITLEYPEVANMWAECLTQISSKVEQLIQK